MIWDNLLHFGSHENWGNPDAMNGMLLLLLDAIRDRWGDARFIVHCGCESEGHDQAGEHPKGNAVDFHVDSDLSFAEQVKRMEMILRELQVFDKVGLGVYPNWNNPGFHLDCRGHYSRWGRIKDDYVGWADVNDYINRKVG